MKVITVKELNRLCQSQIAKGNGDKTILISSDDEGNCFHTLFYEFVDEIDSILQYKEALPHGTDPYKVVLLG